jgi:ATP-dependent Zn protease
MTARERRKLRRTAIHEAGHAVADVYLRNGLHRATIVATDNALGHVASRHLPRDHRVALEVGVPTPAQRRRIEAKATALLAGPAAERRFVGRWDWIGASSDIDDLTDLALNMAEDDTEHGPTRWFAKIQERAVGFVDEHWEEIGCVADALMDRRTLSAPAVRKLVAGD